MDRRGTASDDNNDDDETTTSSTSSRRLRALLRECADARRQKNPTNCLSSAQTAVSEFPLCVRAHRNLCWSLFALQRYEDCQTACQEAAAVTFSNSSTSTIGSSTLEERKRERFLLRRVQHACVICKRITVQREADADNQSTATDCLRNGWYGTNLRERIETGEVLPVTPMAQPTFNLPNAVPNGPLSPGNIYPGLGAEDIEDGCWAVQIARGGTPTPFVEWRQVNIGGGERTVAVQDVLKGFPLDQSCGRTIFLKDRILSFTCSSRCRGLPCLHCLLWNRFPVPTHRFPCWRPHPEIADAVIHTVEEGRPPMDVFYGKGLVPHHAHANLRDLLDKLGRIHKDFPVPKYQNIIDPNIGVKNGIWVPTELQLSEVRSAPEYVFLAVQLACHNATNGQTLPPELANSILSFAGGFPMRGKVEISSNIPDLDPHSHAALYAAIEHVMQAAVPLLAKLKRPALLLPGPLQAVVKAQRIIVEEGQDYAGVWHEDGMSEHVVAVILYYYRASECLRGGDMEIASKQTQVVGWGDWGHRPSAEEFLSEFPRCKVSIQEGTLLVFSNYAAVHRVLPMVCESGGSVGYRDFLAFFVIDQRNPLPVPTDLGSFAERRRQRLELLQRQLIPRGRFGLSSENVYSTGNGMPYDLGWIRGRDSSTEYDDEVVGLVSSMNLRPKMMERGISCCAEIFRLLGEGGGGRVAPYNPESSWSQHVIKGPDGNATRTAFVDWITFGMYQSYPEEGVGEYEIFDSFQQWNEKCEEVGFYWEENSFDET